MDYIMALRRSLRTLMQPMSLAFIVCIYTYGPFFLASLHAAQKGFWFTGIYDQDVAQYLALARQVGSGWLAFYNPYSTDRPQPTVISLPLLLVGFLCSTFHPPITIAYHILMVLSIVFVMIAACKIAAVFLPRSTVTLFLITVTSVSGFGWLVNILGVVRYRDALYLLNPNHPVVGVTGYAADLTGNVPNLLRLGYGLLSLLAIGVNGLALAGYYQATCNARLKPLYCALLAALFAVSPFIHPYTAVSLILVPLVYCILRIVYRSLHGQITLRTTVRDSALAVVCSSATGVALLILRHYANQDAAIRSLSQLIWFIPPIAFVIGYGLLTVCLAYYALFRLHQMLVPRASGDRAKSTANDAAHHSPALFLLSWLLVGVALIYNPVAVPWRFVNVLLLPVVMLSLMGLDLLSRRRLANRLDRRMLALCLVLSFIPSNALSLAQRYYGFIADSPLMAYMISKDYERAFDFIATENYQGTIASSQSIGAIVPVFTNARSIIGQNNLVADADEKLAALSRLFSGDCDVHGLQGLGLILVIDGPEERKMFGETAVGKCQHLRPVWQGADVTLWHNVLADGSAAVGR
jgi:hypothetical protein